MSGRSNWPVILVCGAVCLAAWPGDPAWAQPAPREDQAQRKDEDRHAPTKASRSADEREERIRKTLEQDTRFEFVDTPLSEVVEVIAQIHDIPVVLDEAALQEEGYASDEPVTLILSDVTLRSALKILLEPRGWTYIVQDEVLKVTSKAQAGRAMEVRVYVVASLVERGDSAEDLARVIRATIRPDSWRPSPAARGRTFGAAPITAEELAARRAGEVRPAVQPRPQGSVEALQHHLVVSQTTEGHDEIAALLRALEEATN